MTATEHLVAVVGLVGAASILFCFVANLTGRLSPDAATYLYLNLLGGALVGLNSFWFQAYPAFIVNLAWMFASMWGLGKRYARRRADSGAPRY